MCFLSPKALKFYPFKVSSFILPIFLQVAFKTVKKNVLYYLHKTSQVSNAWYGLPDSHLENGGASHLELALHGYNTNALNLHRPLACTPSNEPEEKFQQISRLPNFLFLYFMAHKTNLHLSLKSMVDLTTNYVAALSILELL